MRKRDPNEIIEVYKLKIDPYYGQPTGDFITLTMTREEYETRRKRGEWIYDDYITALFISQD